MYLRSIFRLVSTALVVILFSVPAFAHISHEHMDVFVGLLHPLTGLDHLLAAIGLGIWSQAYRMVMSEQKLLAERFNTIGSFVAVIAGLLLAVVSIVNVQGALEWLLAASVCVFGLMILTVARLPFAVSGMLAGFFIVCHTAAHVIEMPVGLSMGYALGFVVTTLALIGIGVLSGILIARLYGIRGLSVGGGVLAVSGMYLLTVVK